MSQPLSEIVEEKTVKCGVCGKAFNVQDMSLDDWNFAWDLEVETACCNACRTDAIIISAHKSGGKWENDDNSINNS